MKLVKKSNNNSNENSKSKIKKSKSEIENSKSQIEEVKSEKHLYDIIDHSRLFTILFSSVEQERYFNILYAMGARNFLISFHYIQKKHLNMEKAYGGKDVKFFIDSGAFTYKVNLEYQDKTLEDWEKQIEDYLRWAEKNKDYIFAMAAMDLESIVGGKKVQEWNEKYFEPFMLRTEIPVCFVWHEDSYLTFEQYCERYPYVGISWNGENNSGQDDLTRGVNLLKTAEKHKAVVHGMAMTQTALLTKLPFFSVDSTTWEASLRYGEVNYWNGQKMSRLKKDVWKSKVDMFSDLGFDKQKLLDEDMEELVKLNVYAFIEAEKYVRDKLKSRMYWLKPDIVKRKSLDDIEYPTVDWLRNIDSEDWKSQAAKFNISQEESEKITIQNCITDMTVILNWENPDYEEFRDEFYTPEVINEIHTQWVNRIAEDESTKIENLKAFFKEVLLGENDKLLLIGTNFDRIVKEREDYITDEEYDNEDLSEMEVLNALNKFLPKKEDGSAPEIDELDDEIFNGAGIVPIRDEKGKFLKGQKKVLKPKKLYSDKYPKMSCDMCFNAQRCPEYKAGYVCAYNKMFKRYNTRDMSDVIQAMQGLADYQLERTQRAMLTETVNGGMTDANTTQMMQMSMQMMGQLKSMYEISNREILKQTKVVNSDGTQEITTQVTNPTSGGILAKIFGDMSNEDIKEETKEEVIVESEVVENESVVGDERDTKEE